MTKKIELMVVGMLGVLTASALQPVREYRVEGQTVRLQGKEEVVDLAKIFPNDFHPGSDGVRWVNVEATIPSGETSFRRLYCRNDWYGELYVNGELVSKAPGNIDRWRPVFVWFKKGYNQVRYRTRAGSGGWICGLAYDEDGVEVPHVDFTHKNLPLRRELHSSGFGPTICSQTAQDLADIKSMGFFAARTHDWAIINPNERVCDYFHIFPLIHADAKDPKNYVFGPTDYLLKRTREETGLDILFRLGTSIEHSGQKVHFNALIPEDFDKVAEVFAGTVRHYNRGWANGYKWNIKYWEIWNEPEGIDSMWFPAGGLEGLKRAELHQLKTECRHKFTKFFVTALKRLKAEFGDSIKAGGPALCCYAPIWMKEILSACKEAGVAPDFLSWHGYANDPERYARQSEIVRKLCDSYGFTKTELIIDEWHYFGENYNWTEMQRCSDPQVKARIWEGPDSHNGIRSACFTLAALASMQDSPLDQAYYYGCRHTGSWGFKDELQKKYKVYYALRLFGDILRDYRTLCDYGKSGSIYTMAVSRPDGGKGLLVVDYGGVKRTIEVPVAGVAPGAKVSAKLLDYRHDLSPVNVSFQGVTLTLVKPDFHSAAFFVEFSK